GGLAGARAPGGRGALTGRRGQWAPGRGGGGASPAAPDFYAFGVVLYEMWPGARPFSGATSHEIARRRLSEPPVSPRTHLPSLPRRWERLILDCLARRPADRPSWTAIRARLAPGGWRWPAAIAVAAAALGITLIL